MVTYLNKFGAKGYDGVWLFGLCGRRIAPMSNLAILARHMVLAFALIIMAFGEASAQSTLAVIAQAGFPYFASPQDIYNEPALRQFEFNMHLCERKQMASWHGLNFLQFILPNGKVVYSESSFQSSLGRDPAGDQRCESNEEQFARRAESTAPPSEAYPKTTKDVTVEQKAVPDFFHRYVMKQLRASQGGTSGAVATSSPQGGAESGIMPDSSVGSSMQADIAEFLAAHPSFASTDPSASQILTKNRIGNFFYGRYFADRSVEIPDIKAWSDKKSSQDFVRARRWYQLEGAQLKSEYPGVYSCGGVSLQGIVIPCRSEQSKALGYVENMIRLCDHQLSPSGFAGEESAKEDLAQKVPKCDDQRVFSQLYRSIARSPRGIAGGLRMTGISQITEAGDTDTATMRVCYAMGAFNNGEKLIRYTYEFVSKGLFEINIVFPGPLESIVYLEKYMGK